MPLDELLAIAERDLKKNQAAFAETAKLHRPEAHAAGRCSPTSKPIIRPPRQAALDDASGTRRDRPLHDRPSHRHGSEGGAGAGAGDAAVPARHDDRVDGHPGSVREGRDRGVLQHDAAGSEVAAAQKNEEFMRSGTTRSSPTCRCTKSGRGTTCSSSTRRTSRLTCARCSARPQLRRMGALLRADGHRRGLPRRRSALPPRADPGCASARRALHRRHPDAHAGHDHGRGARSSS